VKARFVFVIPMKKILIPLVVFILWPYMAIASVTREVEQGIMLFQSQQYDAAQALLERALGTTGQDATIHYYLCRISFALEVYDKAVEHCKTAVQLQEDQPEYHFWLGRSYGAEAADADPIQQAVLALKIRRAFEKTIALDPAHVQARVGLAHFYLRAPVLMGGNLDKAYEQIQILIDLDEIEGRLLLARFYEKTKQLKAAEAEYQRLQRLCSPAEKHRAIYKQYGYFLLRHKRYDDAIQAFAEQASLFPSQAVSYEALGDGYSAGKRWQEAIEAYRKALQLDPAARTATQKLQTAEQELTKGHGRQ
jgi:tetratricopeptide (TPR) repeat protein